MRRFLFILLFLILPSAFCSLIRKEETKLLPDIPEAFFLYVEMQLDGVIGYPAFEQAVNGYNRIEGKKKELMTLIDFTKPSTEERLFVIDMKAKRILYSSLVSHGRNSGNLYATSFSNKYGSFQSSLGFYLTESTYTGKNGYSLILEGLEAGINDRAKERAIVMHGAPYSNPSVISGSGRLGRSLGCPALPQKVSKEIINTIKEGSLLFIYADDEKYLSESSILKENSAQHRLI